MRRIRVEDRYLFVDDRDYAFVKSLTLNRRGGNDRDYVYGYKEGMRVSQPVHRLIARRARLSLTKDIDHKNQNKFDCRRRNLRAATRTQNFANRPKYRNNTSGFKGVIWSKQKSKWQARLFNNRQQYHLGFFSCPEEAHRAYVRAAVKHFGEFANP